MRRSNLKRLSELFFVIAVSAIVVSAQDQTNQSPKDKGPSYEDTVKWIQDHIGESGFPSTTESGSGLVFTTADAPFGIKFDGCDMRLSFAMQLHTADTSPVGGKAENDMTSDSSSSVTFNLHLAKLGVVSDTQSLPFQGLSGLIPSQYLNKNFPTVVIEGVDAGAGTFSDTRTTTDPTVVLNPPIIDRPIASNTLVPVRVFVSFGVGKLVKGLEISYARPGTEDSPKHMINALQHLINLCKANPDAGPKELF
jgi:hypothetical protein